MSKYPLCDKAGFHAYREGGIIRAPDVIEAEDVEAFLASAPVFYGIVDDVTSAWGETNTNLDTHTARLIFIEPIVKDEPVTMNLTEIGLHEYLMKWFEANKE